MGAAKIVQIEIEEEAQYESTLIEIHGAKSRPLLAS